MTMNSNRTGGLLALSILALALAGMLGFAGAPFMRLSALTDETAASRQLLAALETQMARHSGGGGGADPGALMLQGETAGIAGANLQSLVNHHVTDAGGQASSFQMLPPQEAGEMTRLPLGFAMRIDIDGLRDVLYAIETRLPLVFVDDIAVRVPESAARESEGDFLGPLEVTMQVSGFLLKDGDR